MSENTDQPGGDAIPVDLTGAAAAAARVAVHDAHGLAAVAYAIRSDAVLLTDPTPRVPLWVIVGDAAIEVLRVLPSTAPGVAGAWRALELPAGSLPEEPVVTDGDPDAGVETSIWCRLFPHLPGC